MQYGKFFKEARKRSGLSQKQVSEKLNIHQSNISDWENDISRPEYEKLIALSELYDVTLYELLGVQDPFFRH
ncbi:MAG: helix-turn-helix domain-containing protein [Clostridia bacterium]|nr:helix-turn-helix domain-containing protein [Clostridia bacterium]